VSFVAQALQHLQCGFVMAENNWLWVVGEEYFFYALRKANHGNRNECIFGL
jgi:hypothetical protein